MPLKGQPKLKVGAAFGSLLIAACVSAPAASAAPANDPYVSVINGKAGWRDCTRVTLKACAIRGRIASGTKVRMNCWIDDSNVTEVYKTNRWFFVTTKNAARVFVHASRVNNQTKTPNCKTQIGIAASRWAAMQVGETVPSTAEKAGNAGMDRWSGWCYVLVSDAYRFTAGYPARTRGSAKAAYESYNASGLISTNMNPKSMSIGSIVFWSFPHPGLRGRGPWRRPSWRWPAPSRRR